MHAQRLYFGNVSLLLYSHCDYQPLIKIFLRFACLHAGLNLGNVQEEARYLLPKLGPYAMAFTAATLTGWAGTGLNGHEAPSDEQIWQCNLIDFSGQLQDHLEKAVSSVFIKVPLAMPDLNQGGLKQPAGLKYVYTAMLMVHNLKADQEAA